MASYLVRPTVFGVDPSLGLVISIIVFL